MSDTRCSEIPRLFSLNAPGFSLILLAFLSGFSANAATPNRVTGAVDTGQMQAIKGNMNPRASARFDRGAVDPSLHMDHMLLLFKPSAAQQADLDQLLAAQQNPSSPDFHKWLTPEEFAARFGLSTSDNSKAVAWLQSQGLTVNESGRGRNWVAFSGSAGEVSRALKTEIHRYQADGETHIANATEPSVPNALADIVGGFLGLNDFHMRSAATGFHPIGAEPNYNSGALHYLAPQDYATVYDVTPLYTAGYDGTGQTMAIVGQSGILLTDIVLFRARYNLPAKNPTVILFGSDPGFNSAQLEGNLDVEWSGAMAPNANIYYIYAADVLNALVEAVNLNAAPVISNSYGNCEIEFPVAVFRSVAQQANAQGITMLSASGDAGAAGCDRQGLDAFATRGEAATFPADLPEVTGVGGTEFNEGNGAYWAAANGSSLGSALSYIPEVAWNESSTVNGLASSAGGASAFLTRPDWQTGPGVPAVNARHVPDVSMSAAIHDGYLITYQGSVGAVAGTSASSPSLAGIVSILNQYQVAQGFQKQPGLGNINPQLYRLAQSAPSSFHDITSGSNIVPCAQGTPDCLTGSFGFSAGAGYDPVTGLGSVDANNLVTQWNTAANAVTVTLTATPASATLNDNVQLTATVVAASGTGTPTGAVNFTAGGAALGSAVLTPVGGFQTASVTFQASLLATGNAFVHATYSGDAAFSAGAGSVRLRVTPPAGAAAIQLTASPNPVYAAPAAAQGVSWQTSISVAELAGVPATITGFTIDGQAQPLAAYFPSTSIPAHGRLTANVVFRNLAVPLTRTFAIAGVDSDGNSWSRQMPVSFFGPQVFQNFNLSATPLTMTQSAAFHGPAPGYVSCPWSQLLTLDETGGYAFQIVDLTMGNVDIASQIPAIFGTTRLAPYGSLQGALCWNGITLPATNTVGIQLADEFGNVLQADVTVSFTGPAANPATLSASPAAVSLPSQTTLSVGLTDTTQAWTASVFPGNRTASWLTLSQYSGTGPGQIALTASGAGFEPGVYRANIVLQSANASPQFLEVPVMFVWSGTPSEPYQGPPSVIAGATNALSYKTAASPGMIMAVFGSQLGQSVQNASTQPLPYSMAGVTATVNGIAAPLYYVSPGQLNIQVPYEAGAGPAVLGINNQGQIAGYQFQIAPSAPGILADANGNVSPSATVTQGSTGVLYLTGDGDVTPVLQSGFSPHQGTPLSNLPKSRLPFTLTVGGIQAYLAFVGITPGVIGLTQVNFVVPASVPAGIQPVVATVGGASSAPVNLTVQAAAQ